MSNEMLTVGILEFWSSLTCVCNVGLFHMLIFQLKRWGDPPSPSDLELRLGKCLLSFSVAHCRIYLFIYLVLLLIVIWLKVSLWVWPHAGRSVVIPSHIWVKVFSPSWGPVRRGSSGLWKPTQVLRGKILSVNSTFSVSVYGSGRTLLQCGRVQFKVILEII